MRLLLIIAALSSVASADLQRGAQIYESLSMGLIEEVQSISQHAELIEAANEKSGVKFVFPREAHKRYYRDGMELERKWGEAIRIAHQENNVLYDGTSGCESGLSRARDQQKELSGFLSRFQVLHTSGVDASEAGVAAASDFTYHAMLATEFVTTALSDCLLYIEEGAPDH